VTYSFRCTPFTELKCEINLHLTANAVGPHFIGRIQPIIDEENGHCLLRGSQKTHKYGPQQNATLLNVK